MEITVEKIEIAPGIDEYDVVLRQDGQCIRLKARSAESADHLREEIGVGVKSHSHEDVKY